MTRHDIVLYGATGYTGQLVADYLVSRTPYETFSFALAGRNEEKLREIREAIEAPDDTPLIVADASDPASLVAMARQAKCVITTVGPFQLYGEPLVAACVEAGADYVDLCGEPSWMRAMIDKYQGAAEKSGARIVFSCGFDSIPFDLGVWYTQQEAKKEFDEPCRDIRGLVRAMKGKFSGGTAASFIATMAAAAKDPAIIEYLMNPFSLTPGFTGAPQPEMGKPVYDQGLDMWLAPFVMATINTKNILRTNFLLHQSYGDDFRYSEMMMAGKGEKGEAAAKAIAADKTLAGATALKPGEGPTREERETGFYDVLFIGETAHGEKIRTHCRGDKDPGYGSTSKMIAEAAFTLVFDAPDTKGGVWTPAAAMAAPLMKRLKANAGVIFDRE